MDILVEIARWLGLGTLAYFIGAIPTAYLFARYALGRDIRGMGDNNSGAANVFREVGPKAGMACGAIDIIKGGVAVLVARFLVHDTGIEMLAGICALAGHIWPIYLRFRGGRGAAVAVGVLIAMLPLIALPVGALALFFLYHARRAIVALAIFLIGIPVLAWPAGYPVEVIIYAFFVPILTGMCHLYSTRLLPKLSAGPS